MDVLDRGLARCVTLGYEGWQGLSWDTHAAGFLQSFHLNELFGELQRTMEKLQQTSTNQGRLLDEVTVVVVSEMGRFPQYNNRNGKEHWTYTSALLMGSGIRGGQTIGQFDPNCFGQSIDLQSGELDANGTKLLPGNLGALYSLWEMWILKNIRMHFNTKVYNWFIAIYCHRISKI